jgi:hypothetical protein
MGLGIGVSLSASDFLLLLYTLLKDVDSQPPKSLKEKISSGPMGLGIGLSLSSF